jgi:hypothetical protein
MLALQVRCLRFLGPTTLVVALLATASDAFAAPGPEPRQPTVAERLAIAKNGGKHPQERVEALKTLARITEKEAQDKGVIEDLIDIVGKAPDISVRSEAIRSLAEIQINAYSETKTKYIEPFTAILKNEKEYPQVRVAIANNFKSTLDSKGLKDAKAYAALVEILRSKQEHPALKIAAAHSIGAYGSPDGVEFLSELVADPDQYIKEAAAKAIYTILQKLPSAELKVTTVNRLGALLDDPKLPPDITREVLKVMAQLIRDGNMAAKNLALTRIIEMPKNSKANDIVILGAIEAMGIIGSEDTVGPLKMAYEMYYTPNTPENTQKGLGPNNEPDLPFRVEVCKAYSAILATQAAARTPNMKVVKEIAAHLISIIDKAPDQENIRVQTAAIFNIRYLYYKQFAETHKPALQSLIGKLGTVKDDSPLKPAIIETLEQMTALNFSEPRRWDEWLKEKYK